MKSNENIININGYTYHERELSQLIRRKMLQKNFESKKYYTRKSKHKINYAKISET